MTGRIGELPVPDGAISGAAVNSALTSCGSLISTSFIPLGENVSVNASPRRRAQRSMTHVGATAQASVCRKAGARGPGGSPVAAARGGVVLGAIAVAAIGTSYRARVE